MSTNVNTYPIRPMLLARTKSPLRYPISMISSISWGVNIAQLDSRSRKRDPIHPSTFSTRLFALLSVYVSTVTAYSIYLTLGNCVRAYFCKSSTLLSLLSRLLILHIEQHFVSLYWRLFGISTLLSEGTDERVSTRPQSMVAQIN